MARVFITGSSTGLGLMAAQLLASQGHSVVLHARNAGRAADAMKVLPQAEHVVLGDVSTIAGAEDVARQVNERGQFDAVIHNVAVGYQEPDRIETSDGLPLVFAANALAPYILTALINKPARLVYLSSSMHLGIHANLDDVAWTNRPWVGAKAYSESKLYDTLLAFGVARRWPDVRANAVDPGWVPTRMGGAAAPDDLDQAHRTQAWLAAGEETGTNITAGYFHHMKAREVNPEASNTVLQERFFEICEKLSGVTLS